MAVNFTPALCSRPAGPSEYSFREELQIAGKCITKVAGPAIDDQLIQPPLKETKKGLSWFDDHVLQPIKRAVQHDLAAAHASADRFAEEKKQPGYKPVELNP